MLALLAALASTVMAASGPAPCVRRQADQASSDPATLEDLMTCQRQALDAAAATYAQSHKGQLPGDDLLLRWQGRQGSEAQAFFKLHPDQKPKEVPEDSGVTVQPADAVDAYALPQAAADGRTQRGKDWEDEQALKKKLLGEAVGGDQVLSDDAVRKFNDYLGKKQGGPTADMTTLMQSMQKDGKPSDQSIQSLRKAAAATGDDVPDPTKLPQVDR